MRLRRLQKNLRCRLGQHGLRVFAITLLKLAAALEAEHNRVARLTCFCYRSMKLRQLVETGEFIQNEPYRLGPMERGLHRAEDQHVKPRAMQRKDLLAGSRPRREKDPLS